MITAVYHVNIAMGLSRTGKFDRSFTFYDTLNEDLQMNYACIGSSGGEILLPGIKHPMSIHVSPFDMDSHKTAVWIAPAGNDSTDYRRTIVEIANGDFFIIVIRDDMSGAIYTGEDACMKVMLAEAGLIQQWETRMKVQHLDDSSDYYKTTGIEINIMNFARFRKRDSLPIQAYADERRTDPPQLRRVAAVAECFDCLIDAMHRTTDIVEFKKRLEMMLTPTNKKEILKFRQQLDAMLAPVNEKEGDKNNEG